LLFCLQVKPKEIKQVTIIAYKEGIMAADTAVTGGNTIRCYTRKIIRNRKGDIAGAVGLFEWSQDFLAWFHNGEKGNWPRYQGADNDWPFAIVVRASNPNEAIEYPSKPNLGKAATYSVGHGGFAAGSGEDFAFGAMFAGGTAIDAVKAAIRQNTTCDGDIIAIPHKGKEQILKFKPVWVEQPS
jgi:ATP-dependent HslUV protease subunit HslV